MRTCLTKRSRLVMDFGIEAERLGRPWVDAPIDACLVCTLPITMTSVAMACSTWSPLMTRRRWA